MNNCNEFLPISNSEIGIGQTTCATQKEANLLVQILLDKGLLGSFLEEYLQIHRADNRPIKINP